jgi:hypothetical protein
MEAGAMKEKLKDIVRVLRCKFNRHEYIVRHTLNKGCDLKICTHCGRSEAAS